jgi:hypothetical protein
VRGSDVNPVPATAAGSLPEPQAGDVADPSGLSGLVLRRYDLVALNYADGLLDENGIARFAESPSSWRSSNDD